MIKDCISLYNDYHFLDIKCYACNSKFHPLSKCHQFKYIPNKFRVIKSSQASIDQERDIEFCRKRRKKFSSFRNSDDCFEFIKYQNEE